MHAILQRRYSVLAKCLPFLLRVLVCTVHAENAKERPAIFENALMDALTMKNFLSILFACLICLGLGACGESDEFVGVWEGKMGSGLLASSSRMAVLVQIKRASSENRYYVKTIAKTEKIPTNPVFQKVMILSDLTAVLENGRLKFEDGSLAEIDPKTGKLHMDGTVFTKTSHAIEIVR